MRRIFKDSEHNRRFERDGYILLNAVEADTIASIKEFYIANSDQEFTGFHNSLELKSPEQKAKIHRFLAKIYDESLSRYFENYRAMTCTFVSKNTDPGSVVRPHQDWSFVNEAKFTSLNLWMPLCDTYTENGALGLFRRSHRLKPNIRGSNIPPSLIISEHLLKHLDFFHMEAGEVLIYDHRMIHASGANKSGVARTAASFTIIPSEAIPIHYTGDKLNPSRVLELEVDENFYNNFYFERSKHAAPFINYVVPSAGYPSREIEYERVKIDEQDILRLYTPKGFTALSRIKNRLRAIVSF